jgi:predicted PhzF superfamily epimerase YddE/YHI9
MRVQSRPVQRHERGSDHGLAECRDCLLDVRRGHWQGPVTVAQGTHIDRMGRVFIRRDSASDTVWVGGETSFLIEGTLTL